MRVALVNTDGGDLSAGERGHLGNPARRAHAERAFQDAVELATRVGARNMHVLLGCRLPDLREQAQRDHVVGLLGELVPEASSRGLGVLVEALNHHDVPGYLTSTPEDVARLIEEVGSNDVRLLFDTYHLARIGRDPVAEVAVFADTIGHVHVADCPGRGPPGTGRLDLWGFVDALDASGYDGPVGLEYMPGPSTPDSLGFLAAARSPAPFP
jgi:hydroxypyruvate isomerase